MAKMADTDSYTLRPRTPNDQYSVITEQQIANLKKDPSPFFHTMKREKPMYEPREGGRFYVDKFCAVTNKHLVREAGADHYGWIDEKHNRHPPEEYNTCRHGASVRWGPSKTGERTRSHFFGESIDRYTTIDMYRRPATNYPGPITMAFGRPGQGYYAQRFPNRVTWFGSSVPLNRTEILPTVGKKTLAEYQQMKETEVALRSTRKEEWPEYSEYTDKYLLNSKTPVTLSPLEQKKAHVKQALQQA